MVWEERKRREEDTREKFYELESSGANSVKDRCRLATDEREEATAEPSRLSCCSFHAVLASCIISCWLFWHRDQDGRAGKGGGGFPALLLYLRSQEPAFTACTSLSLNCPHSSSCCSSKKEPVPGAREKRSRFRGREGERISYYRRKKQQKGRKAGETERLQQER